MKDAATDWIQKLLQQAWVLPVPSHNAGDLGFSINRLILSIPGQSTFGGTAEMETIREMSQDGTHLATGTHQQVNGMLEKFLSFLNKLGSPITESELQNMYQEGLNVPLL